MTTLGQNGSPQHNERLSVLRLNLVIRDPGVPHGSNGRFCAPMTAAMQQVRTPSSFKTLEFRPVTFNPIGWPWFSETAKAHHLVW